MIGQELQGKGKDSWRVSVAPADTAAPTVDPASQCPSEGKSGVPPGVNQQTGKITHGWEDKMLG